MNTDELQAKPPLAIALGFFDGVHLGHGALLNQVKKQGIKSCALTFDQHPCTLLGQLCVPLLTSTVDRQWLMKQYYQVDQVMIACFSQICSMDWEAFIEEYLVKQWNVVHIVAGHDFHFGKGGLGNPEKLQEKCKQLNIQCDIISAYTLKDKIVSSTHIRKLLQSGKLEEANQFLGHPHTLSNEVQHGNKIGAEKLGFPTVNLSIPPQVIIPSFGVYACRVWIGDVSYQAVTNIGIRPTVEEENNKEVTVEGYLLDFSGEELYGKVLRMEFYSYLREEKKFENFQALSKQIATDVESTKEYFRLN